MGTYKIVIHKTARSDFEDIIGYLNTLSPQAALKYYDLITESIESLGEMPERLALLRDTQLRLRGYRALSVGSYRVFFVINGKTVHISRILFEKRQFERLL